MLNKAWFDLKSRIFMSLRQDQVFATEAESRKMMSSKGIIEKFVSLESDELNALLGIYVMEPETIEEFFSDELCRLYLKLSQLTLTTQRLFISAPCPRWDL
jgi:hypothetical protein